ncbi:hypothetical protein NEF87_000712 [Candidatus Lokiarchaeum ossiferum]|uniref:Uncharacterized protein n=1 Tax=Candidatus Lokiarchaeum ossiferum TaxID=2951803 RepID=A0ABY6HNH2_9ARCH|nr:hypothetical protein NEF87_000712 [Candidatus Lokiarchaeum sp. B-35]
MIRDGSERIFDRNEETPGEMVRTNSFTHLVYAFINLLVIIVGVIFLVSESKVYLWILPIVIISILGLLFWIFVRKDYFSLMINIFSYIIVACTFLTILALLDIWGVWPVLVITLLEISLLCMNYYDSHPGTVIFND